MARKHRSPSPAASSTQPEPAWPCPLLGAHLPPCFHQRGVPGDTDGGFGGPAQDESALACAGAEGRRCQWTSQPAGFAAPCAQAPAPTRGTTRRHSTALRNSNHRDFQQDAWNGYTVMSALTSAFLLHSSAVQLLSYENGVCISRRCFCPPAPAAGSLSPSPPTPAPGSLLGAGSWDVLGSCSPGNYGHCGPSEGFFRHGLFGVNAQRGRSPGSHGGGRRKEAGASPPAPSAGQGAGWAGALRVVTGKAARGRDRSVPHAGRTAEEVLS